MWEMSPDTRHVLLLRLCFRERGEGGLGPSIWRASAWGLLGAYPYKTSIRKRDLDAKDHCVSSIFITKSGKV